MALSSGPSDSIEEKQTNINYLQNAEAFKNLLRTLEARYNNLNLPLDNNTVSDIAMIIRSHFPEATIDLLKLQRYCEKHSCPTSLVTPTPITPQKLATEFLRDLAQFEQSPQS